MIDINLYQGGSNRGYIIYYGRSYRKRNNFIDGFGEGVCIMFKGCWYGYYYFDNGIMCKLHIEYNSKNDINRYEYRL